MTKDKFFDSWSPFVFPDTTNVAPSTVKSDSSGQRAGQEPGKKLDLQFNKTNKLYWTKISDSAV